MSVKGQPWRKVVRHEGPHTGRGGLLGPDTDRRTAWWVLHLECGHETQRIVKYLPDPNRSRPPGRGKVRERLKLPEAMKPPPKKVRCDYCRPPCPTAASTDPTAS